MIYHDFRHAHLERLLPEVPTLAVRPAELESRVAEVLSDIMSEKHMEPGKNEL